MYVHTQGARSFLVGSSLEAWNVAPQALMADALLDDVSWTGTSLPREIAARLGEDAPVSDTALFSELLAPRQTSGPPYLLWPAAADAPAPYLSDRVDDSFAALRQRVVADVGWDFLGQLDNLFAPLDARPMPGESIQNWNKAGRAFDFYYRFPISLDPQVEVVREDRGTQTFWRIYLRTAAQDGSQGAPLRQRPWDFQARYDSDPRYYDQGGRLKGSIPAGYYVDFTALAADYGWERVPALENWHTYFQGIRYWHFEKRDGLTWDDAMREIYSEEELAGFVGGS
jgi:TolB protein